MYTSILLLRERFMATDFIALILKRYANLWVNLMMIALERSSVIFSRILIGDHIFKMVILREHISNQRSRRRQ